MFYSFISICTFDRNVKAGIWKVAEKDEEKEKKDTRGRYHTNRPSPASPDPGGTVIVGWSRTFIRVKRDRIRYITHGVAPRWAKTDKIHQTEIGECELARVVASTRTRYSVRGRALFDRAASHRGGTR